MKVRWYCGLYDFDGHTSLFADPPECTAEFDTEVDEDDWSNGICEVKCPQCNGILSQVMDHASILEEIE
jgi:hypothetical protein